MKKKMLSLFIAVAVCFTATACSSTPAPTETDAVESTPIPTESVEPSETPAAETESPAESETPTPEPSVEPETPTPEPSVEPETSESTTKSSRHSFIKKYKDSFISCNYDSSILYPSLSPSDEYLLNQVPFYITEDFYKKINGNISGQSCLYVFTIPFPFTEIKDVSELYSTSSIEELFSWYLFSILELGLEPGTKLSSTLNIDGTSECRGTLNDSTLTKIKLIAYTDNPANSPTITFVVYKFFPNDPEEYKEALTNCYDSIQYRRDDDLLVNTNCNWIKEGELFDSITSIDDNIQLGEYNNNKLEIAIHLDAKSLEEDVVRFFSVMDKICADCNSLLESYSKLTFRLFIDTDADTWITSLSYSKSNNSNIFYLNNPITLVRNYRSIVDDVYSTYQPSNDNFRKTAQK